MRVQPEERISKLTEGRYDKRFIYLLVSLLTFLFGALFIPPSFSKYLSPIILLQFAFAGLILFRNHNRVIYRVIMAMAFLLVILEGMRLANATSRLAIVVLDITYLAYFILSTLEVFRQILLARRIDLNMVAGAFCGFIMLGVLGSFLLAIIETAHPGSFSGIRVHAFNETFQDLIYYSFVTLLTIGYGDILPISSTARKASLVTGYCRVFLQHLCDRYHYFKVHDTQQKIKSAIYS